MTTINGKPIRAQDKPRSFKFEGSLKAQEIAQDVELKTLGESIPSWEATDAIAIKLYGMQIRHPDEAIDLARYQIENRAIKAAESLSKELEEMPKEEAKKAVMLFKEGLDMGVERELARMIEQSVPYQMYGDVEIIHKQPEKGHSATRGLF